MYSAHQAPLSICYTKPYLSKSCFTAAQKILLLQAWIICIHIIHFKLDVLLLLKSVHQMYLFVRNSC